MHWTTPDSALFIGGLALEFEHNRPSLRPSIQNALIRHQLRGLVICNVVAPHAQPEAATAGLAWHELFHHNTGLFPILARHGTRILWLTSGRDNFILKPHWRHIYEELSDCGIEIPRDNNVCLFGGDNYEKALLHPSVHLASNRLRFTRLPIALWERFVVGNSPTLPSIEDKLYNLCALADMKSPCLTLVAGGYAPRPINARSFVGTQAVTLALPGFVPHAIALRHFDTPVPEVLPVWLG